MRLQTGNTTENSNDMKTYGSVLPHRDFELRSTKTNTETGVKLWQRV